MRWLALAEGIAVLSFAALATLSLVPRGEVLAPIDAAALAAGPAEETWNGIFLADQHIGYAMSREAAAQGGGRLFEQRAAFTIAAMGVSQQVVTMGTALVDDAGRLQRFDFLLSSPVLIVGRGEVRPGAVHVELQQDGELQVIDVPVKEPPSLSMTATQIVRGKELKPGDRFETPYFDPVTMSQSTMVVTVEAPELLANGEVAWWLSMDANGLTSRRLVDPAGGVLREESAMGLRAVRMTQAEAMAVDGSEPPDLVALAKVPISGQVPAEAASLSLVVSGVEASRFASDPPLQAVAENRVRVSVPPEATWPVLPVTGDGDTEATVTLQATHAEIVQRAREVVADAPDRATAARRLHDFVHEYVAKVPTMGVPNGLGVLRSAQGDCNEHTALYVSLARAAGIPSRIAAGLVYSQRLDHAFYYHAWPEVRLGPGESWVPIDPTFDQFPADATHLKVVTGDLDRQLEIMGLIGKVRLAVDPAR